MGGQGNLADAGREMLRVAHLRKTYKLGRVPVPVLHGVELEVRRGACVAILGASGSGKSTLLHLCGGLDRPDRARNGQQRPSIVFDGRDMARAGKGELDRYRSHDVGFVFQFYHLLPELTVLENVTIGAMIRHGRLGYMAKRSESVERATALLKSFGLGHRLRHRSSQLSGGERQRVAIARALINDPELLLADEPTGNLDRNTGGAILDAIFEHRERTGLTVLMVTHDEVIAERADRVVRLVDGRVTQASGAPEPADADPGASAGSVR
ncbi:MAG: ABC transporter ATP-binding protein [Planctomycetota bacterium]